MYHPISGINAQHSSIAVDKIVSIIAIEVAEKTLRRPLELLWSVNNKIKDAKRCGHSNGYAVTEWCDDGILSGSLKVHHSRVVVGVIHILHSAGDVSGVPEQLKHILLQSYLHTRVEEILNTGVASF